jgi:hypothetical protein
MSEVIPTAERLLLSGEPIDSVQLEALERAFFSSLVVQNGTFKTTNHRRLDDLNELVSRHLPPARPLRIMDVAVSSGISTAEWMSCLERAGVECSMVAGDLFVDGFLVALGGGLQVLVDKTGKPMQFDIRGVAYGTPLRRRALATHPLAIWRMKRAAHRFITAYRVHGIQGLTRTLASRGLSYRPVKLISQSLKRFARLEVVEDDISIPGTYSPAFHVLRASNILNLDYFAPAKLTAMLINLRSRLMTGGQLIVCRTSHQNVNHASIYSLDANGSFSVVARLNDGSEIEPLVLNLPPTVTEH